MMSSIGRRGGVSQKMTVDDRGEVRSKPKDDAIKSKSDDRATI